MESGFEVWPCCVPVGFLNAQGKRIPSAAIEDIEAGDSLYRRTKLLLPEDHLYIRLSNSSRLQVSKLGYARPELPVTGQDKDF